MISEATVVDYLVSNYNAKAIILHGSRGDGTYRENSDWDLFILTDVPTRSEIAELQGQSLDIGTVPIPVSEAFVRTYIYSLLNARALLDTNENVARNAIQKAKYLFSKGYRLTEQQVMDRRNALYRNTLRLQTTTTQPEYFLFYLGNMYSRAIGLWFELAGLWPQTVIKYALLDIGESDPEYHELLRQLSSDESSAQQKANAAKAIYNSLFPE